MLDSGSLCIEVENLFATTLVTLTGDIDDSNFSELIDALGRIRPLAGSTVVVDIGEVGFLGVSAIQVLILSASRLGLTRCPLLVARSKPITRRVLTALGADPKTLLLENQAG